MHAENFIEIKTRNTRKKGLTFGVDALDKLEQEQSNPLILPLYNRTVAPVNEYKNAYSTWFTARNFYRGKTAAFEQKVAAIPSKCERWEAFLLTTFPKSSPQYISVFPNGRAAVYSGTYEDKTAKLQALANSFGTITLPTNPQAEVQTFHDEMKQLRTDQQMAEDAYDQASDIVEAKRLVMCTMLYKNYGALIDIFGETPDEVNRFFEWSIFAAPSDEEEDGPPPPP